jgi:mono/diheme cytochrome c family protein
MTIGTRELIACSTTLAVVLPLAALRAGAVQVPAVAPPQVAPDDMKLRDTFVRVCVKCHTEDRVVAEGRSRIQWENTIIAMQTSRGAIVTPEEFDVVLEYLTKYHGRYTGASAPGAAQANAQPAGRGRAGGRGANLGPRANVGAADRHRVDPAGAVRGQKLYATECVTCHGASARGTERGPNLIRSTRMLRDRYGSAIGPYLKAGHPMQTGSAASLADEQITDISHFIWDRINNTLRGSPDFDVKDVLTGDAATGRAYFNGEGQCAKCHSPMGDLAGYGKRFAPVDIQQRFVFPFAGGGRGRGGAARPQVTVTVTIPNGAPLSGTLVSMDDFHVALRDKNGEYRSWARTPEMTIVKNDPFAPHVALLDRLTDKAMHDVVAYLESLK